MEHCNRLGWKDKFGFPSQMAMEALGIKKHQTFISHFNDLCRWGFVKLIKKSQNQYSANIISLQTAMPKNGKALDKAFIKHRAKQTDGTGKSTGQSNGIGEGYIIEQGTINKEQGTKELLTNDEGVPPPLPEISIHSMCKKIFEEKGSSLGKEIYWTGQHGKCLNLLLKKLKHSYGKRNENAEPTNEQLADSFKMLLDKLPEWYKENHFDLSVINSKYDTIVSEIRKSIAATPENRNQRAFDKIDAIFRKQGKQV